MNVQRYFGIFDDDSTTLESYRIFSLIFLHSLEFPESRESLPDKDWQENRERYRAIRNDIVINYKWTVRVCTFVGNLVRILGN